MNSPRKIVAIATVLLAVASSPLFAGAPVGTVTAVSGTITVARAGEPAAWSPHVGDGVLLKDTLTTGSDSAIKILFEGSVLIIIGEDSEVEVSEILYAPKEGRRIAVFRLITGRVRSLLESLYLENDEVRIVSANSIAGVKGTDFVVEARETLTDIYVLEGVVEVRNADRSVVGIQLVKAGFFSRVLGANPPQSPRGFSDKVREKLSDSLWLADSAKVGTEVKSAKELAIGTRGKRSGPRAEKRISSGEQISPKGKHPQQAVAEQGFIVPHSLSIPPSIPAAPRPAAAKPGRPAPPSRDPSRAPELF